MPLPDFEPTMVVSDAQRGLAGPQRRILDLDRCMVELEINAPGRLSAFQDCPGKAHVNDREMAAHCIKPRCDGTDMKVMYGIHARDRSKALLEQVKVDFRRSAIHQDMDTLFEKHPGTRHDE